MLILSKIQAFPSAIDAGKAPENHGKFWFLAHSRAKPGETPP
jgi:hypothetical protein